MARINITTPVGRLVGGSIYDAQTTDYQGNPLTAKDKVTPRVDFSFGVAIPKSVGVTHWSQEAWGAPIWALANAEFTNGETQRHDFSSKITDGDSTIPNKRGKKPSENEGYKGHWVVWFSGGFAPKVYNADGSQLITEPNAIKRGYYVQVFGNVSDNKPSQSPGLYMNHSMVALTAYGEEIQGGADVSEAGFGKGAVLPAGASTVPVAAFTAPVVPVVPTTVVAPPPVIPVIPVVPNPAILNVAPPPVPPVPAAPVRQMTALAQGASYEQLIAAGWNDTLLIQNGMMLA